MYVLTFTGYQGRALERSTNSEAQHPSIIFRYKTQMKFSSKHWAIIMDLDTTDVDDFIQEVRQRLLLLEDQFSIVNETKPLITQWTDKNSMSTVHHFKGVLSQLEAQIHYFKVSTTNARRSRRSRTRDKRAFCDLCGQAINTAFGLATEQELEKLQEQIADQERTQNNTIHIMDKQLTFIQQLQTQIRRDREHLAYFDALLRNYTADNKETTRNIFREITDLQNFVDISAALLTLQTDLSVLNDILTTSRQGNLSPALITPELLRQILFTIREKTPLHLITDNLQDNLFLVYQSTSVSIKSTDAGLKFIVRIPLMNIPPTFDVYRLFTLPNPNVDNSLFTRVQLSSKYFAIAKDRSMATMLQSDDINECHEVHEELTICHPIHHFLKSPVESCAWSHFANQINPPCQLEIIKDYKTIFLKNKQGYNYATPTKLQLTINCMQQELFLDTITLEGTGYFRLNTTCTASNDKYFLPDHQIVLQKSKYVVQHVQWNWTSLDLPDYNFLQQHDSLIKNLMNDSDLILPMEFEELRHKINRVQQSDFTTVLKRKLPEMSITVGTFLLLTTIITIVTYKCYSKRKKVLHYREPDSYTSKEVVALRPLQPQRL